MLLEPDPALLPKLAPAELPEVKLLDVKPSTFRAMLRCLHSDATEIKASEFPDVFHLADEFRLDGLRLACLKLFDNQVTTDNVCSLLESSRKVEGLTKRTLRRYASLRSTPRTWF
jgi:hypothetical protein